VITSPWRVIAWALMKWNRAKECQIKTRLGRFARDMGIQSGGARSDLGSVDVYCVKVAPQTDNDSANTTIAHDQVGSDTNWENRDVFRQ